MRAKREDSANGNAGRQSPICTPVQKAEEKGKNRCSRTSSRVYVYRRMKDRNDAHRWKIDPPYPRIPKPIRIIADRTIHIIAPCSRSRALFLFFSSPPMRFTRNPTFGPRQSFTTVRETTLNKLLKTLVIRFIILRCIKCCCVIMLIEIYQVFRKFFKNERYIWYINNLYFLYLIPTNSNYSSRFVVLFSNYILIYP